MEQTNQPAHRQITTRDLFSRDDVKKKFTDLLGKKAQGFITSVLQTVASNKDLQAADPNSIYQAAAVAAILDLPINNNLGFAYIVAYKQWVQGDDGNKKQVTVAQFQMGYKGFIQLSLRSGQFEGMNATDVREGEIKHHDRLTGKIQFEWEQNEAERLKKKIIGYVSYFGLINGFSHVHYMSIEKIEAHAKKYSQTYKRGFGLWKDDFDGMAQKTVTKLNLSKNAPLSIEMQRAFVVDQAIIKDAETQDVEYVDNTNELPESQEKTQEQHEQERITILLNDCTTEDQVSDLQIKNPNWDVKLFVARKEEIRKASGGHK